jgi:diguanylate cyclase (GGDEF)-like protein
MRIRLLRNKLLLSVAAVSIVFALASMLAVSFVVRQQHLDQSNALLHKASRIINNSLEERKENQLIATRRLATQSNLGSTIWYLAQYAQSDVDRETLFTTYQQLVRDTYKLGRTGGFSKTAIYDVSGNLVSFSLLDRSDELVGFVERFPQPMFQVSSLKNGDEISRKSLITTATVAKVNVSFGSPMPKQEAVHYSVVDGFMAIETYVPILDLAFDATTGKQEIKQLGLVVSVQPLDQLFVDQLARVTDIKMNIFTPMGFSVGHFASYRLPDWTGVQTANAIKSTEMAFNEIVVDEEGFYQTLIPFYKNQQLVGTIVALHSKKIVQKDTWQMVRILGLIAIVCFILILPIAWYFANSISKPLTTLGRVFRGVASGKNVDTMNDELNELARVGPENELGDLTHSFIMMVDTVKQKIEQINEINASLENRVEESTAQLRAANAELGRLANIDALTNLCNRRSFFEIANLAVAQIKRSKRNLSLIMLDVDNFKSINDKFGHPVGDEVLRQIGDCLAQTARESDTPARYGGEEFVVLATNTDLAECVVLAERIRAALKMITLHVDFQTINPSASIGVACLRPDETFEQLCARADAAMYLAKNAGRDRVIEAI